MREEGILIGLGQFPFSPWTFGEHLNNADSPEPLPLEGHVKHIPEHCEFPIDRRPLNGLGLPLSDILTNSLRSDLLEGHVRKLLFEIPHS